MLEEPPLLTLVQARPKPSQQQIETLARYATGFLVDAMQGQGALSSAIRPLDPQVLPTKLCGPVLTCDNGPADILATLAALTELQTGDVLVCATGAWQGCAAAGDRVLGMACNAGAAGFVTDGMVRDIEGIRPLGLPVFCAGLSPNSPYSNGPGVVGGRITLGGVTIHSGDILAADENGVVIVPFAQIDAVIETLKTVERLESELDAEVANGLIAPQSIYELLESDKVARI